METIPVKEMKKWAKDNLPPMAWQRVVFRTLPQLNKIDVFLHTFDDDAYVLSADIFKILDDAFLETFKKQFVSVSAEITPVVASMTEKVEEALPIVVPIIEKVEEITPPKEEEKIPQTPADKPFVPFFSPEQLKRIFGKKE